MQWTAEAEAAIKKVPVFVRKRVRARVENEARQEGKTKITLTDVQATQKRYLSGMAAEVKGYQLDMCFGPAGCPHQIQPGRTLADKIEQLLCDADLLSFLKSKGIRDLKYHHEFRISLADCPNACSQPQIKDIGIIGAALPRIGDSACSGCGACVEACREAAIRVESARHGPQLDAQCCVACGQCVEVCPTGTLKTTCKGYRVLLGGKLGRHPQLAKELPGIFDTFAVLDIVQACLEIYKNRSRGGERFGDLLSAEEFRMLTERFAYRTIA